MEHIDGTIKKIIFHNTDTGYTVFSLQAKNDIIKISGIFFSINENDQIRVFGKEESHPKYGKQFKSDHYENLFPQDLETLTTYLSKGIIKGIGPAKAKRIVETFGSDTLNIMENYPERLAEISGISDRLAQLIGERMAEKTVVQKALFQLSNYGIPMNTGVRMYKFYKERLFSVLQRNPYQVVDDVSGIGFQTMDKIALGNGIPVDSSYRVESGIKYTLDESEKSGHVYLPYPVLMKNAKKLLEVDNIESIVTDLIEKKELICVKRADDDAIYRTANYHMEVNIAKKLIALNRKMEVSRKALNHLDSSLDEVQTNAVKIASENGVMILTGGPGVGKTTTTNLILKYFLAAKKVVKLAAPTGRAAKRMQEATGMQASTIHRLLDIENGEFKFNASNPLKCDVVIIDEVSMLDMPLMNSLVNALPETAQLILVGDKNQLPSVGKGNILSDIIKSNIFPVVELKKIYRQSNDSEIILNAHRILARKDLQLSNKDFFFKACDDPEEIKNLIIHYVADSLPEFTKETDIQVLAPMRQRALGVNTLNQELQQRLNPNGESFGKFRLGDKVLQVKNNYNKVRERGPQKTLGVFNGDVGYISKIDDENEYFYVKFEDGYIVKYKFSEADELDLAYALTIHKSQGSEYPVVVIPIYDYVPTLTTMNLLYTAVTRARKYILLVGSKEKLHRIIHNYRKNTRYTALDQELVIQSH